MLTHGHHDPDLAVFRIGLRCVDPGVRHKGNHLPLEELLLKDRYAGLRFLNGPGVKGQEEPAR